MRSVLSLAVVVAALAASTTALASPRPALSEDEDPALEAMIVVQAEAMLLVELDGYDAPVDPAVGDVHRQNLEFIAGLSRPELFDWLVQVDDEGARYLAVLQDAGWEPDESAVQVLGVMDGAARDRVRAEEPGVLSSEAYADTLEALDDLVGTWLSTPAGAVVLAADSGPDTVDDPADLVSGPAPAPSAAAVPAPTVQALTPVVAGTREQTWSTAPDPLSFWGPPAAAALVTVVVGLLLRLRRRRQDALDHLAADDRPAGRPDPDAAGPDAVVPDAASPDAVGPDVGRAPVRDVGPSGPSPARARVPAQAGPGTGAAARALLEAGRAVTAARGDQRVVAVAVHHARRLTASRAAAYVGVGPDGRLDVVQDDDRLLQPDRLGEGVLRRAVDTGRCVRCLSHRDPALAWRPVAVLVVPVVSAGRVVGALVTVRDVADAYDRAQERTLRRLASVVASSLHAAHASTAPAG